MKLAFSTLGCPGWSFEEIFATAKDLGMDGIEVRGIGKDMYAPKAKVFSSGAVEATKKRLSDADLEVSMLTSGVTLSDLANKEDNLKEARDYIDLCEKLGCRYVRIMGTNLPQPSDAPDTAQLLETYCEILDYSAGKNVFPLIETNGIFADTKALAAFIRQTGRDNAFVLWDIHHPYRFFGEKPEDTVKNLEGLIKYVHIKDSANVDGKLQYRMMGYGDIPVLDALSALKRSTDENLYVSLEWVKRWQPDLSEPGIVFYHFANYMHQLFRII